MAGTEFPPLISHPKGGPMTTSRNRKADVLRRLFEGHQEVLQAELTVARRAIDHPTLKGDNSEAGWAAMLTRHLPERYRVCRGVVVDCRGGQSEQIDVIIHDAQYCPVFQKNQDTCFVPAESVYAVFEVKQDITRAHLLAAGKKAESVRKLHRTSAGIVDRGIEREARPLQQILAGILSLDTPWTPKFGEPFKKALKPLVDNQRLDLGCAVAAGYFEWVPDGASNNLVISDNQLALAKFFLRLVHRLQKVGTVPAIDWTEYSKSLGT